MTPERDALTRGLPLGERDVHVWVVPLDDPDKKRRRELAHLAERMLLGSYLGMTPAMLEFERGPGGKPRLRGEPLQYNLSHSERLALVGVARSLPLGVDVQGPHPTAAKPWLAKRICSSREYDHFHGAPSPEALLRLWARKEAVIKARGEGSYVAVGEIDVLDDRLEGGWLCRDIELTDAPGFHAAVAVRDQPGMVLTARSFAWS
ncbi:MAG: 4'-phosphopantetheinyl transferase family protein [Solirubrobacteraceae bacterium]